MMTFSSVLSKLFKNINKYTVVCVTSKGYPCSLIKTTDVTWTESERNSNARIMPKSKVIRSSRRKYNQRMTTLQLA